MRKLAPYFWLILVTLPLLCATYPFEYPLYLGELGFSKTEISDLRQGGTITHSIEGRAPGEYGIVAARVFNVPVYYFRDYYDTIESYKTLLSFQDIGKFKAHPDLLDLKPLRLSESDMKEYLACDAQHCDLNLSEKEIASIPKNLNRSTDASKDQISDSYRRILLARLIEYQKSGNAAMSAYHNGSQSENPGEILKSHLLKFHDVVDYFPVTARYITDYPAYKNKQIYDFFYWSKDYQGNKPIIALRHVFGQRVGSDYILVNKVIYCDHYLLSSLSIMHLIDYTDDGFPRTLFVLEQRSLSDLKGNPVDAFGRNILRTNLEKRVTDGLKQVGEVVHARYTERAYDRFPFGLVKRDQR
jgi:hypothetical protein